MARLSKKVRGRVIACGFAAFVAVIAIVPGTRAAPKTGVSPQTISLPTGPGSIEGLGASFEPQLNTGTAAYAVSFALPPGRHGLAPRLGAAYSGGHGNGVLGIGWSLTGIDFVERQSDKGLPTYDGTSSWKGTDTFVTSSGEELVPLSDGSFRAENEGGFRRYQFDPVTNRWTCEERDGTKRVFGAVAGARIENGSGPGGAPRTFRWYVTSVEDTNGNRVEFFHRTFPDSPGMVYVDRVEYGSHAVTPVTGRQVVLFTYETATRPDPFSDFRSGFEMTMGRRLARVDVCTRGGSFTPLSTCDAARSGGAARVRAYRFEYDEGGACSAGVCSRGLVAAACNVDADCMAGASRLAAVVPEGADGVSRTDAPAQDFRTPPIRFRYTELGLFSTPEWRGVVGLPGLEVGGPEAAFIDMDADGEPDLFTTPSPGTHRQWRNEGVDPATGVVSFEQAPDVNHPAQPLSEAGTQVADLDGDGMADLVQQRSSVDGAYDLYPGTGRGYFASNAQDLTVSGLAAISQQGLEDPNLRLVDLDFDKRTDVLQTDPNGFGGSSAFRVLLHSRFSGVDSLREPFGQGPCAAVNDASFAGGKTFLADLNGDRLLDLVVMSAASDRFTQIRYYPATGRGGFGRGGSCSGIGQDILLGGAPVEGLSGADYLTGRGFYWQDLNADGAADLLWIGPSTATVWLNVGGGELRRRDLGAYPNGITMDVGGADAVELVDVNANGTTDVLLVDKDGPSVSAVYLDVVGPLGAPANLLAEIDNGLGRKIEIQYETSTRMAAAAKAAGREWHTRAPFPLNVVARRLLHMSLDLDGTPGEDIYRTDYRYRDPWYDAQEKEFRGFAEVTVIERGDASSPSHVMRNHFHTGAPDGVNNDDTPPLAPDSLIDEVSYEGGREEEPLKGVLLETRDESCSDGNAGACDATGTVFRRTWSQWSIRNLYGATGKRCAHDPAVGCCTNADCANPFGPATCNAAGPDEAGLFSSVQSCVANKSVRHAVPKATRTSNAEGSATPVEVLSQSDFDGFGNETSKKDWGVVAAASTPQFGCLLASGTCSDDPSASCGRDVDCGGFGATCIKRSSIDGGSCSGDAFAFSNPVVPNDERFETRSFATSSSPWLVSCVAQTSIGDELGSAEAQTRSYYDGLALGQVAKCNLTRREEWLGQGAGRWIPRVRQTFDEFGNVIGAQDALGHARTMTWDVGFKSFPTSEVVHLAVYDLTMTADYHEGYGAITRSNSWATSGAGPATDFAYDAYARLSSVVRPLDGPAAPTTVYVYELNPAGDGVSNVATKNREAAGAAGTVDAYAYVDGLGRKLGIKTEGDGGQWILEGATGYTLRGLSRASWLPYFTATPAYEAPGALLPKVSMAYDVLGRTVQSTNPDGTFSSTVHAPLSMDLFDENDNAGVTPGAFHTQRVDGLGRLIGVTERTGGQSFATAYGYDARGNLLEILDAQGNRKTMIYDSLSRRTFLNDPDRGFLTSVFDDADNMAEAVDAKGQRIVLTYDEANRIKSENYLNVTGNPVSDPVDVSYFYDFATPGGIYFGDGTPAATQQFTAGELASVIDLSGEEHVSFNARRRVAWSVKRVRDPLTGALVPYATTTTYDSLDRPTSLTYPDGDRVVYGYGTRGLLTSVRGAALGLRVIDGIAYRASGQLDSMIYGNGVVTTWTYDSSQRLQTLRTVGASATAGQDLLRYSYSFDPVSNVTAIEDLRAGVLPGTPRHDTQRFGYDGLHRIVAYQLSAPGNPAADFGRIGFGWDRLGNMLLQTATFDVMDRGRSVTNLGLLSYGGAAGASNRNGRGPSDPPGPHALTSANDGSGTRAYPYDANGNMTNIDGLAATWDFKDRLVRLEDTVMRADYVYDRSDQRITKKVVSKVVGAVGTSPPTQVTHYVSRLFEVRPPGQATKFVFAGDQRVAEVTGTLDLSADRVQRLGLVPGWNLVSIAVQAADAVGQLGLASNATITSAYRWNPGTRAYDAINAGASLSAGSVVWVYSTAPLVLSVRGSYSPPTAAAVPAGGQFVPSAGLETIALASALPVSGEAWIYDAQIGKWRRRAAGLPAALADLPPFLGPGEVVYVTTASAASVSLSPANASLRFHHPDYLGSTHVITDGEGRLVEEAAYLPFGAPRLRTAGTDFGLPGTNYLYTGKERDSESGIQYFEARYLDGPLARFLSVDPAGINTQLDDLKRPQLLHAYSYSRNNPINYVDPTGRYSEPNVKLGRNQVIIDAFIPTAVAGPPIPGFQSKGDNRPIGMPSTPNQSRLTIWVDTDSGKYIVNVSRSSLAGSKDSRAPSPDNRIVVSQPSKGSFEISIHARNSATVAPGLTPAIDSSIFLQAGKNDQWTGRLMGDAYPAYEINAWRGQSHEELLKSPEGGGEWLGPLNLAPVAPDRDVNFSGYFPPAQSAPITP